MYTYESNRRSEYGVRRSDVLVHPSIDDPLALHNALSSVVDDGQVSWLFKKHVKIKESSVLPDLRGIYFQYVLKSRYSVNQEMRNKCTQVSNSIVESVHLLITYPYHSSL